MKKYAMIAGLMLSASVTAADDGERWLTIGEASGGTTFAVDRQTLQARGDAVTAWVKFTYAGPPPAGVPADAGYMNTQLRFQCEARTVAILSMVVYSPDGKHLADTHSPSPPSPVIPDSVNERIWSALCTP